MANSKSDLISQLATADEDRDYYKNPVRIILRDLDNGIAISPEKLLTFSLTESLLCKIPYGSFSVLDSGTWRSTESLKPGSILFIQIGDSKEYGRYIITSSLQKYDGSICQYLIKFVYDALSIFNTSISYPRYNQVPATSKAVLREVCETLGFTLDSDVDSANTIDWINPGLSASDFMDLIVNHTYIDEEDFPLFWMNRTGIFRFSSGNTLMSNTAKSLAFVGIKPEDSQVDSDFYATDVTQYGLGYNSILSNPVHVVLLDEFKSSKDYLNPDITNDSEKIYQWKMHPPKSAESRTDEWDLEKIRKNIFLGYHTDIHPLWELIPVQNRINKRAFFMNTNAYIIPAGLQEDIFNLQLGNLIIPDSSVDKNEAQIISSMRWFCTVNSPMILDVKCNNGYKK